MSDLARGADSPRPPTEEHVTPFLELFADFLPYAPWLQEGRDELYVRDVLVQERKAFHIVFNAFGQQTEKAFWTVVRPLDKHTCTVILLHERGEFPQNLARRLFESPIGWDLWTRAPEGVPQT